MSRGEVRGQGIDDGSDGIVAALFESAKDRHQHGLAVGAALTPVAVAVLANDHCRADRPFARVVVERNARLIEEREQIVLMTPQSLDETLCVGAFPGRVDQLLEAILQTLASRGVCFFGQFARSAPQPDRVAQKA